MSRAFQLLIYGCNGYIGRLTSERAALHPAIRDSVVLAGRNKKKVAALANRLGLRYRIFSLDRPQDIDANLRDVKVVLNLAGPFAYTTYPLILSCLRVHTHYLDVTTEPSVFHLLFETLGPAIARAGIVCVPGVGFDLVPTDVLSAMLHHHLPSATHLDLSFAFSDQSRALPPSPGTAKTHLTSLADPTFCSARRDGQMRPVQHFYRTRRVLFPNAGPAFVGFVPWADCLTAYYTTKIPNIDTFAPVDPALTASALWSLALLRTLLRYFSLVRWLLFLAVDLLTSGPTDQDRKGVRIDVWGEVRDEKTGDAVRGSLQTMEGYGFASCASLEAAREVIERAGEDEKDAIPAGVWTPSRAFSPNFIFTIPNTTLYSFIRVKLPLVDTNANPNPNPNTNVGSSPTRSVSSSAITTALATTSVKSNPASLLPPVIQGTGWS